MKKLFQVAKKAFFYLLTTALVILSAAIIATYLYGDQIKDRIIASLNTHINTPINVDNIELDIFEHLPYLTIELNKVAVRESIENSTRSLLEAQSVHLLLNPLNLIRGNYTINNIQINDGFLRLMIDRYGRANYLIVKPNSGQSEASTRFDIRKLSLENVDFEWKNIKAQQDISLFSPSMVASVRKADSTYFITHEGFTNFNYLMIGQYNYAENKKVWSAGTTHYHPYKNLVEFPEGILSIANSDFTINGSYDLSEKGDISLKIEGKETDVQNLITLLPADLAQRLSQYQSTGDVYFDVEFGGQLNSTSSPTIATHFGFKNANILHPESNKRITNAYFEGWYISSSLTDLTSAELTISDLKGELDGSPFTGELSITNFNDKALKFRFTSKFPVESLIQFYPNKYLTNGSGIADIDIYFEGKLNDLKDQSAINKITSNGKIGLENVNLQFSNIQQNINSLNGELIFDNHKLVMNQFSGFLGSSQFELNGSVGNIFSWLLLNDEYISLNAHMKSSFIDLDELLSLGSISEGEEGEYALNISPLLFLTFDCQIDRLLFRRFDAQNISGQFKTRDQLAMLQDIKFSEAGGDIALEGLIDTKGRKIDILTKINMYNINIDSLFYVFEDFNQDFLVSTHLSGKVNSEVMAELSLTRKLEFIPQSLVADMGISIRDGELISFEPMQLLSDYLPEDDLKHLRFGELKNDIHIEDQKVYLPQMQISSNATDIMIGGTHTFDQYIHYKIVAPLIAKPRVDPDEVFGAIEDDGSSVPKIHLLLTGTTDEYFIKLDKQGMKNQVVSNLKKEVDELKNAFKKRREDKKKTLKLSEDEYIDWEDY